MASKIGKRDSRQETDRTARPEKGQKTVRKMTHLHGGQRRPGLPPVLCREWPASGPGRLPLGPWFLTGGVQSFRRSRVGPEDHFCETVVNDLRVPLTAEGHPRTLSGSSPDPTPASALAPRRGLTVSCTARPSVPPIRTLLTRSAPPGDGQELISRRAGHSGLSAAAVAAGGIWTFSRRPSAAVRRRRIGAILGMSVVPRRRKARNRRA